MQEESIAAFARSPLRKTLSSDTGLRSCLRIYPHGVTVLDVKRNPDSPRKCSVGEIAGKRSQREIESGIRVVVIRPLDYYFSERSQMKEGMVEKCSSDELKIGGKQ